MLRFFKVEDRTLKRHISIGVFSMYIDTRSPVSSNPSKSHMIWWTKIKHFDRTEMIRNNRINTILLYYNERLQ